VNADAEFDDECTYEATPRFFMADGSEWNP
jgi:hypothetical protein